MRRPHRSRWRDALSSLLESMTIHDEPARSDAARPGRRRRNADHAVARGSAPPWPPAASQFTWLGVQKSLTPEQKAAGRRGASTPRARSSPPARSCSTPATPPSAPSPPCAARSTRPGSRRRLPFPEPGVRLIRQDQVEAFAAQMTDFRVELDDAVAELDRHYGELKRAARRAARLALQPGRLPRRRCVGLFGVALGLPQRRAARLPRGAQPRLYEQERARVAARFEEAVQLAEQAFLEEFARLVAHLGERLTATSEDGSPRSSATRAVGNLREFFERFRELNVRSQRAARRAGEPRPSGPCAGSARRSCATAARCASGWRRNCPGCSRRSTPCWSTVPGGGSSAAAVAAGEA